MDRSAKITRHIIAVHDIPSFMFLGIVSSETDYRLSVLLNRHLGADFRKSNNDITDKRASGANIFSRFTTSAETLSLISNRCEGATLIRKLKNIDFLLVMHGKADKQAAEELAALVRSIPEITAVFIFDSSSVSDRNITLLPEQK